MSTQDDQHAMPCLSDDQAVTRLFELACNGETANREFWELDNVVQERLLQAYGVAGALDLVNPASD